jgi:hypothetical protein
MFAALRRERLPHNVPEQTEIGKRWKGHRALLRVAERPCRTFSRPPPSHSRPSLRIVGRRATGRGARRTSRLVARLLHRPPRVGQTREVRQTRPRDRRAPEKQALSDSPAASASVAWVSRRPRRASRSRPPSASKCVISSARIGLRDPALVCCFDTRRSYKPTRRDPHGRLRARAVAAKCGGCATQARGHTVRRGSHPRGPCHVSRILPPQQSQHPTSTPCSIRRSSTRFGDRRRNLVMVGVTAGLLPDFWRQSRRSASRLRNRALARDLEQESYMPALGKAPR